MAQTLKLKRSAVSGNAPSTSDLALGEIAINTYDGKIFIKKDDGTESIVTFEAGGSSNAGTIEEDSFSGNGSTTAFTLTTAPSSEENLLVFIDATFQNRDSFTISGTTITFDTAPDNGTSVRVYHVIPGTVDDGILTVAKFAANTLVTEAEGISSNDNDTTIPTSAAVKDYVDTQVATVDTLPEVLANGNTTGGTDIAVSAADDITFTDTSKAIFGTDSDLELYHNGSNAFLTNTTGDLYIQDTNGSIRIRPKTGESGIDVLADGAVNLYYDNTSVLSTTADGISVTSEVEADEFIGDLRGAVLFKAQAGENVTKGDVVYISGISGNTTVVSKADADDASKMPAFGIVAATTTSGQPVDIYTQGILSDLDTSAYSEGDELFVSTTAGALTNTAPTGETALLQKIAKVTRSNNLSGSIFITGAGRTNAVPNLNTGKLFVGNASNQAVADDTLYVDIANSRVGIGTTSPGNLLHLTASNPTIYMETSGGGATDAAYIQKFSNDLYIYNKESAGKLILGTNNATKATIDSSGNLLVAQSSTTTPGTGNTTTGISLRDVGAIHASRDGNRSLYANRNTSDGQIISVQKDGTEVGSIGTNSGQLFIGNEDGSTDTGLLFGESGTTARAIIPARADGSVVDGALDLGYSSGKFKDLYLSGEVEATALDINGNGDISGNLILGGYLAGPATFTIDPAAVGDNTGTVVIAGNLQVDGTTTTINSTTLTVDDLNITLASGAANAAAANGAGITVDGASATITYDATNDEWDFNKNLNVSGSFPKITLTETDNSNTYTMINQNFGYLTIDNDAGGTDVGHGIIFKMDQVEATRITQDKDVTWNEDNGGTPQVGMHWDYADGRLGIGTTSPSHDLTVQKSGQDNYIRIGSNSDGYDAGVYFGTNADWSIGIDNSNSNAFSIASGSTVGTNPRVTIDSSGNVGIGGTPTTKLYVEGASPTARLYSSTTTGGTLDFVDQSWQSQIQGSAGSLLFKTGGTAEAMRITSGGNVGINLTDPQTYGGFTLKQQSNTSSEGIAVLDSTSAQSVKLWVDGTNSYLSSGNSGADPLILNAGGGNVGIGTDSPASLISGGSSPILSIGGTDGGLTTGEKAGTISFITSDASYTNTYSDGITGEIASVATSSTGAAYGLAFYTGTITGSDRGERLRIRHDGNVGIGTDSPDSKLTVNVTSNSDGIELQSSETKIATLSRTAVGGQVVASLDGVASRPIHIGGIVNEDVILANAGGNVGIGNTSPNAKLQVEEYGIDTTETSTTATTQVAIHTMSATTFRSARFTVQVTNSTDSTYHLTEILMIHDGTTPSITEYGTIFTGSAEATFDADISSGNVRLLATPASTDTMEFKVVAHSITT